MSVDPLVEQIRQVRASRGVPTYVLADLAGLARTQAYHVESGRASPTLVTLRALATALRCDIRLVPDDESCEEVAI